MLTFEPAKPEDLEPIYTWLKGHIETYEDLQSIDYPKVIAWVRRNIESKFSDFRRVYWNGTLAGYYCLTPNEEKMELDSLYIFPEFQGRGIGTSILQKCLEESPCSLFLYVFKANIRAFELYQRMGFQVVKELKTRYIMEYEKQGC